MLKDTCIDGAAVYRVLTKITGGGFYEGSAVDRRYNLSFIVENSVEIGKPIIGVSLQYRLGPFGFLNGDLINSTGLANLGLKVCEKRNEEMEEERLTL